MHAIHPVRILLAGLVAGVIIIVGEYVLNAILLADQWAELRQDYGIAVQGTTQVAAGGFLTLSYGVVLMWMFASMRASFATDFQTAIVTGYTFWSIAYLLFLLSVWASGFVTFAIAATSIAWGIVEAPLATIVGMKVYRAGLRSQ